jgi:hypothetical protein
MGGPARPAWGAKFRGHLLVDLDPQTGPCGTNSAPIEGEYLAQKVIAPRMRAVAVRIEPQVPARARVPRHSSSRRDDLEPSRAPFGFPAVNRAPVADKRSGHYEQACVDCRTGLGGFARGGASRHGKRPNAIERQNAIGRPKHPAGTDASSRHRHLLHRRNDGDVLQHRHRSKHEWIWNEKRLRIEQWLGVRRPFRIGWRRQWGQHIVFSAVPERAAIQRAMRLTKTRTDKTIGALPFRGLHSH